MPAMTLQQAFDLARQQHQAGRLELAESIYRQILARQPGHADALHLLGVLAQQRGQHEMAVELIGRSLGIKPGCAEAHYNMGNALHALGRLEQAVNAYRQAVALKPEWAAAYSNLGTALAAKGQPDDAIAAYQRAISLRDDLAEAHYGLGVALRQIGQLDQAIAAHRQALVLKPNFIKAHNSLVLTLHYHGGMDALAIAREQRRWNECYAAALGQDIQGYANDRNPERRLRIGYVSADFWDHASAHFLLPLLENHDPAQVELFAYAQVLRPDAMTEHFQALFSQWRNTVGLSDEQVAQQIRADQIDVLVDLKLHTGENRLLVFARKPAPVQVTWLGYPGSTGLTAIDYRLSDPYLDPSGMDESIYSEQTVRLPDSFWCYDPLAGRDIPVNGLPVLANGFITFGCLNNFNKINENLLVLWAQVLRQVDKSRLLLMAPEGAHRQRTVDRLALEGIDPGRVEFVPRQPRRDYLQLYHRIDAGLDSFPVNGHTTSLDSFWMGVPVVTLVGPTAMGRAGWCQLSNLGLNELAGHSAEQFVTIAVGLASDLPRLVDLRATLRPRMAASPLMDAPRFAGNIEAAYRRMWHKYCVGEVVQ